MTSTPSNALSSLLVYLQAGGWSTHLLLIVAVVAIPASIGLPLAALSEKQGGGRKRFAVSLFVLGALAIGLGLLGWRMALGSVLEAVASANPADKAAMFLYGSSEARTSVVIGLAVGALPIASGLMTLLMAAPTRAARVGGLVLGLGIAGGIGTITLYQRELQEMENALAFLKQQDQPRVTSLGLARADALLRRGALVGIPIVLVGILLVAVGAAGRKGAADGRQGP